MTLPPEIIQKLPAIKKWIENTLGKYSQTSSPVASFNFSRLRQYFSKTMLEKTKVVIVSKVPIVPLSEFGLPPLPQLINFENGSYAGITYLDTYFLISDYKSYEQTHFHELVHIIQWKHLGFERFLVEYAQGLLNKGYRDSPLERMAYEHEKRFEKKTPYDVEKEVLLEFQGMGLKRERL